MDTVEVEVLRPFNKTPRGDLAEIGEKITVEPIRAQELAQLGLARPVSSDRRSPLADGAKAAPAPDNKMAPEPSNKSRPAVKRKPLKVAG